MASSNYGWVFTVDSTTPVSLSAGVAKTVGQVKFPTNGGPRLKILKVVAGFQGVNTTDKPVLIQFYKSTTNGTFTSVTAKKRITSQPGTIGNYVVCGKNASGEPTPVDIVYQTTLHPQGSREYTYYFEDGIIIEKDPSAEAFNFLCLAAQAQDVFFTISGECA